MKVLVIGGGGREHCLAWKLAAEDGVDEVIVSPGNAGTAPAAGIRNHPASGIEEWLELASNEEVGLTVVGPEAPLAEGLVDRFTDAGLKAFGPRAAAAELEASKSFAKEIMVAAGIPTAAYEVIEDLAAGLDYLQNCSYPIVLKADGLAAGKGVVICESGEQASETLTDMMEGGRFGAAGHRVVAEEFMEGEEASILAITDGETVIPLLSAQDHKRALDGDEGPNTGGMGAYAPAPAISGILLRRIQREILQPTVDEMKKRGKHYRGILYAGLMITPSGPRVVEFNCRFGDPETQAILPLLESDLSTLMLSSIEPGGLRDHPPLRWRDGHAVCVVAASAGYPGSYSKGHPIEGIETDTPDALLFQAGTRLDEDQVLTSGGRVLAAVGLGSSFSAARSAAYERLSAIRFEGISYRADIGFRHPEYESN